MEDVLPEAHAKHTVDAFLFWYLPGWQSTHLCLQVYLPAAQEAVLPLLGDGFTVESDPEGVAPPLLGDGVIPVGPLLGDGVVPVGPLLGDGVVPVGLLVRLLLEVDGDGYVAVWLLEVLLFATTLKAKSHPCWHVSISSHDPDNFRGHCALQAERVLRPMSQPTSHQLACPEPGPVPQRLS